MSLAPRANATNVSRFRVFELERLSAKLITTPWKYALAFVENAPVKNVARAAKTRKGSFVGGYSRFFALFILGNVGI